MDSRGKSFGTVLEIKGELPDGEEVLTSDFRMRVAWGKLLCFSPLLLVLVFMTLAMVFATAQSLAEFLGVIPYDKTQDGKTPLIQVIVIATFTLGLGLATFFLGRWLWRNRWKGMGLMSGIYPQSALAELIQDETFHYLKHDQELRLGKNCLLLDTSEFRDFKIIPYEFIHCCAYIFSQGDPDIDPHQVWLYLKDGRNLLCSSGLLYYNLLILIRDLTPLQIIQLQDSEEASLRRYLKTEYRENRSQP